VKIIDVTSPFYIHLMHTVSRICNKGALQVRLCKKDRPCEERVTAAETLAYLTEVDTELQRLASISNHLVPTLAELLRYEPEPSHTHSVQLTPSQTAQRLEEEVKTAQDMKQAAFRVNVLVD